LACREPYGDVVLRLAAETRRIFERSLLSPSGEIERFQLRHNRVSRIEDRKFYQK
jgi:hypothetical protein